MSNPASYRDVQARWRPLTSTEIESVAVTLDDAWQILLARSPGLQSRIDTGGVSSDLVVSVICAMALRVLRNPDGKRQESIDDYSWTRDNSVSGGLLYATDDELRLMAGYRATSFSITPGFD